MPLFMYALSLQPSFHVWLILFTLEQNLTARKMYLVTALDRACICLSVYVWIFPSHLTHLPSSLFLPLRYIPLNGFFLCIYWWKSRPLSLLLSLLLLSVFSKCLSTPLCIYHVLKKKSNYILYFPINTLSCITPHSLLHTFYQLKKFSLLISTCHISRTT